MLYVCPMGLDKCIMTCIHHYCTIQNSFTALKILCALPFLLSLPPLTPGNQTPFSLGTLFIFWTFLNLAAADSNLTKQRGQQMCSPSSSRIDWSPKTQQNGGRTRDGAPSAGFALGSRLLAPGHICCTREPSPFSHLSPWPHPPHCAASQPDPGLQEHHCCWFCSGIRMFILFSGSPRLLRQSGCQSAPRVLEFGLKPSLPGGSALHLPSPGWQSVEKDWAKLLGSEKRASDLSFNFQLS